MKRKLVLKTEKVRVLTDIRLVRIAGGMQANPSDGGTCGCMNSQLAICDLGSKG